MPQINVTEQDNSKYADQQFISISYNGNTNSLPMPEGEITITENDTYNISQYATAIVNVPNPSAGTLNITENNEYDVTEYANVNVDVPNPSTGALDIAANGEYDVTDYATASVNVPNPSTGTLNITENDKYDVTEYASANVNVKGDIAKIGIAIGAQYIAMSLINPKVEFEINE